MVNNVGISSPKAATDYTAKDISTIMGTNFESGYHLSQLAHPLLKSSGAVNPVTRNLACERAKDNICVNVVAPAVTNTRV
ncbi:hypothetical protein ACOSQ2_029727 [Xanthoceras sorbifolium]